MEYITIKDAAEKWSVSERRICTLCAEGRIEGAQRFGWSWAIPFNAQKPEDARIRDINQPAETTSRCIKIERSWAMPNKNTFDIKPIKSLILNELSDGLWIDPFANKNKLANITNDLNKEYDTDFHLDALDFLTRFDTETIDGVLYDPPYSPRQVSECYNDVGYNVTWDTTKASFWGNHKREISRIVKVGGKVITFGWNSGGIGKKYGFEIERILLVPHGGWHNDTICTVERKICNSTDSLNTKATTPERNYSLMNEYSLADYELINYLKSLPYDFWDFKNENTRDLTHGIHSYPAMMIYPISRNIINVVKDIYRIESLLDPFSGSGTVLVEGILNNIPNVVGNDINPLARLISKVKTTPIEIDVLMTGVTKTLSQIESYYSKYQLWIDGINEYFECVLRLDTSSKEGWGTDAPKYMLQYLRQHNIDNLDIPNFKNLGYWFKPNVVFELLIIKDVIKNFENLKIRDFLWVAFSETIRLVSNRRNGEFKMFRLPVEKVRSYNPNVKMVFERLINRNILKMNDFLEQYELLESQPNVLILSNNSKNLCDIPDNSVDLVITSPPYGDSRTTVAYGEFSRLSLQWIDMYNMSEREILDIDKKLMGGNKYRNGFEYNINSVTLKKSLETIKDIDIERAGDVFSFYYDLSESIKSIATKSKKNSYQFWVVGNRTVKGIKLSTNEIIVEIAESLGLRHIYTIDRNISNKVMPSLNSPTNQSGNKVTTMTNEHIVVLRKL